MVFAKEWKRSRNKDDLWQRLSVPFAGVRCLMTESRGTAAIRNLEPGSGGVGGVTGRKGMISRTPQSAESWDGQTITSYAPANRDGGVLDSRRAAGVLDGLSSHGNKMWWGRRSRPSITLAPGRVFRAGQGSDVFTRCLPHALGRALFP
jgi:hypothetical protein